MSLFWICLPRRVTHQHYPKIDVVDASAGKVEVAVGREQIPWIGEAPGNTPKQVTAALAFEIIFTSFPHNPTQIIKSIRDL